MKNDYTIWVSYHKDEFVERYNLREDEHHKLFATHKDAELDNINVLNPVLSEMVTMWYVWRNNLISPIVGFEHYRRHLTVSQLPKDGECIVFTKMKLNDTIYHQYGKVHCYADIEDMLCVLDDIFTEDNPYVRHILEDDVLIANCTFLMPWQDFIRMCSYLFNVLHVFCHRHIHRYDQADDEEKLQLWRLRTSRMFRTGVGYQTRCLSFLAERLISAWIKCNMKIIN